MSWHKVQLLLKAHGRHWCQCFGEHLCHGGNSRKTEVEPSPPKLCLLITDMGQALPKLLQPVFSPQGSSMWNPKCALVGSLSNLRWVSHLKNNPVHSVAGHCTSSWWLPFSQMNSRLIHWGREGKEHLLRTCTAFYIHRWFKPYPMGWDLFPQFADKENQPLMKLNPMAKVRLTTHLIFQPKPVYLESFWSFPLSQCSANSKPFLSIGNYTSPLHQKNIING